MAAAVEAGVVCAEEIAAGMMNEAGSATAASFSAMNPFYMCDLYLPPFSSSCYHQAHAAELYQDILAEVAEARVPGEIVLTGDFNLRIADLLDQFDEMLADNVVLPYDNEIDVSQRAAPLRQSHDTVVTCFCISSLS